MDILFNTFKEIKSDDAVKQHDSLTNEIIEYNQIYRTQKCLSSHLKSVTVLLNTGDKKWSAIQQLLQLIPQCLSEHIIEFGEKWLRLTSLVICAGYSSDMQADGCKLIILLLKDISKLPEVSRTITSKHASNLLPFLLNADIEWRETALQCVYEYGLVFPQHLSTIKKDMEKLLISTLDMPLGESERYVTLISRIYATIPSVGKNGTKASSRGEKITNLYILAMDLCDRLLENVMESMTYDSIGSCSLSTNIISSSSDPLKQIVDNVTYLSNTLTCISEVFSTAADDNNLITFNPNHLIDPFLRILRVKVSSLLKQRGHEYITLALFIPSLHIRALNILRKLFNRPMIAYSLDTHWSLLTNIITQVVLESRQSVSKVSSSHNGVAVRESAYKLLDTIFMVSQGRVQCPPKLIFEVIKDVSPDKEVVTLQNAKGSNLTSMTIKTGKNKKRKVVAIATSNSKESSCTNTLSRYNSGLISAALELIKTMVQWRTIRESPHFNILYKGLLGVGESLFLQTNRLSHNNPYHDGHLRAGLLKALMSLSFQPHFNCPPPYIYMSSLVQAALADPSSEVKATAHQASVNLSFILANPNMQELANIDLSGILNKVDKEDEIKEKEEMDILLNNSSSSEEDDDDEEIEQINSKKLKKSDDISKTTSIETQTLEKGNQGNETITNDVIENKKSEDKTELKSNTSADVSKMDVDEVSVDESSEAEEIEDEDEVIEEKTQEVASKPTPVKKPAKETKRDENEPSLEDMLATFVNADPDSD